MKTKTLIKCLLLIAAITAVFPSPVNGDTVPALWGIAERHGLSFSFDAARDPIGTFNDFGRLQYAMEGELKSGDRAIETFIASPAGLAYLAANRELGGLHDDALISLDLDYVTTDWLVVIDFSAQLDAEFGSTRDSVTDSNTNPIGGEIYALFHADADRPSVGLWWLMK